MAQTRRAAAGVIGVLVVIAAITGNLGKILTGMGSIFGSKEQPHISVTGVSNVSQPPSPVLYSGSTGDSASGGTNVNAPTDGVSNVFKNVDTRVEENENIIGAPQDIGTIKGLKGFDTKPYRQKHNEKNN